jgi:hypothetical protein
MAAPQLPKGQGKSWSSIASTSKSTAPTANTSKSQTKPVEQKSGAKPSVDEPKQQSTSAQPTKPSNVASIAIPPSESTKSAPENNNRMSWSAMAKKTVPPKAAPKSRVPQPTTAPAAVPKSPEARKPAIRSPVIDAEGWASLPTDFLAHHLYFALARDFASVKVARRVCRKWGDSIPLPRVVALERNPPSSEDHLTDAAKFCKELVLPDHPEYLPTKLFKLLQGGPHLEHLHITTRLPLDAEHFSRILKTSPNLRHITIQNFLATDFMEKLLAAMLAHPAIQRIDLEATSTHSVFFATLLHYLPKLPIYNLLLQYFNFSEDQNRVFGEYLSTTTTLERLVMHGRIEPQEDDPVFAGIKANRSLKHVSFQQSSGVAMILFDAALHHPSIEHLRVADYTFRDFGAPFRFYAEASNLKTFCCSITSMWERDETAYANLWMQCLSVGRNFNESNVGELIRIARPGMKDISRALKANKTFRNLRIDASWSYSALSQDTAYEFSSMLLDGNRNIEEMELCRIMPNRDEDVKALCPGLSRAKGLKRFKTRISEEITTATSKLLVAALSKIPTLEEIRILGRLSDVAATDISTSLAKNKLQVIELKGSEISSAAVTSILQAAAQAGSLRILDLSGNKITATNGVFNTALVDCLRACPLEHINLSGASVDPSTINAISNTLRSLETCTMRKISLGNMNIPPLIRKNLDAMILEKAGLISLDLYSSPRIEFH